MCSGQREAEATEAEKRFEAALKVEEFATKAIQEQIDASLALAKEIAAKPLEEHTEAEKRFVVATAKMGMAALLQCATSAR